jgi:hypothetical protein
MKKQKETGGKGILSYIGSSRVAFEQSANFFSPLFIKILGLA